MARMPPGLKENLCSGDGVLCREKERKRERQREPRCPPRSSVLGFLVRSSKVLPSTRNWPFRREPKTKATTASYNQTHEVSWPVRWATFKSLRGRERRRHWGAWGPDEGQSKYSVLLKVYTLRGNRKEEGESGAQNSSVRGAFCRARVVVAPEQTPAIF